MGRLNAWFWLCACLAALWIAISALLLSLWGGDLERVLENDVLAVQLRMLRVSKRLVAALVPEPAPMEDRPRGRDVPAAPLAATAAPLAATAAPLAATAAPTPQPDAWAELMEGVIEVDYMRSRMRERRGAWLAASAELWPAGATEAGLAESAASPGSRPAGAAQPGRRRLRALVWPYASYKHFGVKRIWSLGEYSQWADLCAALATLGVQVKLGHSKLLPKVHAVDMIFTDYDGIHELWRKQALPPPAKTWLLDTFGTDGTVVEHPFFGRRPPLTDYPLGRFLTLVPDYSFRNTFLGAAVVAQAPRGELGGERIQRRWQCLLWSKVHPWLNTSHGFPAYHKELLQEYSRHCRVVATVDRADTYGTEAAIRACCPEVEVRGVESPGGFLRLLRASAVYLGVGEPLIAPSCFEALGLGTHVIQPRFPEPRVLKNKPLTQAWTSQHPYLEKVPEPFAFTIHPANRSGIAAAFARIRKNFDAALALAAKGETGGRGELAELARFYERGEHPKREAYSMTGFLDRVRGVVRRTGPLQPGDWDFERQHHPEQLPAWVRGGSG